MNPPESIAACPSSVLAEIGTGSDLTPDKIRDNATFSKIVYIRNESQVYMDEVHDGIAGSLVYEYTKSSLRHTGGGVITKAT